MLHFCRNWPNPTDYLKLINQILDEEKNGLIKNTKRDIQIYKMNYELDLKENKITNKQSADYKKYKYKCYYKINIIGKDEDLKKENYIEIDGNRLDLGKNSFILFKKLAEELKENMESWVEIEKFVEEIDLSFTGKHQLIERLRKSLTKLKFIDKDSAKELIENNKNKRNTKNKKGGFYRISNHPDFITYNKEKLLNNEDPRIRKLAEEMPIE